MPAPKTKWQERDVWFTAGHNFGERIMPDIGPSEIAEVIEAKLRKHNERVESGDLVWTLGGLARPGYNSEVARMNGKLTVLAGPDDDYFAGAPDFEERAEALKWSAPNVQRVITGRTFRKNRKPIQIPLGFGFAPILLWSLPYAGSVETAPWRPPIPTKSERLWILHGQLPPTGEPVDPRNRQISVHFEAWNGRPASIDDIRETIRNAS
jgi:calcineurin-like phosphoesterase family protein